MLKTKAIVFCLLLLLYQLALVDIAYATSPNDLEIAFAKVSDNTAGGSEKTAGCLAVWLASDVSASNVNIYCRYELGNTKDQKFQRDDDNGIDLSSVKLYSSDQATFPNKIKTWFEKKYPSLSLDIYPNDLEEFAYLMSTMEDNFPQQSLLGKQIQPKTYHLDASSSRSYHEFAPIVHELVKEKVTAEIARINQSSAATTADNKVENAAQKASAQKLAAQKAEDAAKKAAENATQGTGTTKTVLGLPPILGIILFLLIIIIIPVLILAIFWLLFIKDKYSTVDKVNQIKADVDNNLRNTLQQESKETNQQLQGIISKLEDQQQDYKKQLAKLEQTTQQPWLPEQKERQEQLTLSKQLQALQQETNRLEQQVTLTKNKLSLEHKQHEQTKVILKETKDDLKTVKKNLEEEQSKHKETEQALQDTQQEVETLTNNKQVLQEVLQARFRLVKPESTDFSHWTNFIKEQPGIWRWLQPTLLGELLACEPIINNIKKNATDKDNKILQLLYIHDDSLVKSWNDLISQLFNSDDELWTFVRGKDGGLWLNRLLRAAYLLQTYFSNEKHFSLLSQHLSNVSGILRAMFIEKGVKLLHPQLLEAVPNYIPKTQTNYIYTPPAILKELVKAQVLERMKTVPQCVVDIQMYGFVIEENPNADVRVFVSNPSEWE